MSMEPVNPETMNPTPPGFFSTIGTPSNTSTSAGKDMSDISYLAYCILGPSIIAVGLVGNILTLITLSKTTLWCNGMTYIYLKCLALTDACALLSAIAMDVRLGIPDRKLAYWEAFYQAHIEIPLLNFFMGCSIFIVVCLTKDRFLSVCFPTKYRETSNNSKAKVSTALCYLFSFLLNAPLAFLKMVSEMQTDESGTSYYEVKENTEITETTAWKVYLYISEGIVRFVPIVLLAVLNIAIIRKFCILAKRRKHLHATRARRSVSSGFNITEERRMLALLSTIVILFVILNLPSAILSIIYTESLADSRPFQIFRACANDLELANFAINFYAYFMCSTEFRNAFFAVICGKSTRAVAWISEVSKSRAEGHTVNAVRFEAAGQACDTEQKCIEICVNNGATPTKAPDPSATEPICQVEVHVDEVNDQLELE